MGFPALTLLFERPSKPRVTVAVNAAAIVRVRFRVRVMTSKRMALVGTSSILVSRGGSLPF